MGELAGLRIRAVTEAEGRLVSDIDDGIAALVLREAVPVETEIERVAVLNLKGLLPLRVVRQIDVGGVAGIGHDVVRPVPCRPRHSGASARMVADVGVRRAADGVVNMCRLHRRVAHIFVLHNCVLADGVDVADSRIAPRFLCCLACAFRKCRRGQQRQAQGQRKK